MNLEINGKSYPLEWGMGSIEAYCDMLDCDVTDLDSNLKSSKIITKVKAMTDLAFCALQNGCETSRPKIDFDLDYNDFRFWRDRMSQVDSDKLLEDWKKSYFFGKTIAEAYFGEMPEDEIKAVSKKKQPSAK